MKKIYSLMLAAIALPTLTFAQPANDTCDGAIEIMVDGASVTADNSDATVFGPEGACYLAAQVDGDVWYTFTTTEESNLAITTEAGTTDDSQMAVFTIADCGSGSEVFTEVACNDDISATDYMSYIEMIQLPAGTYFVKAGTYGDAAAGSYTISLIDLGDVPANSFCDGATVQDVVIDGATSTVTGSGTDAVDGIGLGQAHVWEAFTITDCADVTLDMCGTTVDQVNAYTFLSNACPVDLANDETIVGAFDFTLDACDAGENISISFVGLEAGTYYYPVMSSEGSQILDDYTVNITAVTCAGEPDTCLTYNAGPWTDFNSEFGGAPEADEDGVCPVNEITAFEIFASESYTIDNFVAGTTYTFAFCEGGSAGAWDAAISVTDPNGDLVVYVEDCTVTWTAPIDGTYIIGISELGHCFDSQNTATNNGFPSLTCEGSVGVSEAEKAEFSIFPNPNNGQFTIRNAGEAGNYNIHVMDMAGRMIHSQKAVLNSSSIATVNLDNVEAGIYMIQFINTKDNSAVTQRVVVQ